jgi:hypothetical protein
MKVILFLFIIAISLFGMTDEEKLIQMSNDVKTLSEQKGLKDLLKHNVVKIKTPTIKAPTIEHNRTTFEDREKLVNKELLKNEIKTLNKNSKYLSKVYVFLKTYGILPRKNGTLPNEKEVYRIYKSGKVQIKEFKIKK